MCTRVFCVNYISLIYTYTPPLRWCYLKKAEPSHICAVGQTKPDLDVPMHHHDQATLSVSTQQPLGAMRTNFTQVGTMGHVLIHYNKDMIMDTDTDTLAYL
jgi:hypothetical protein